MRSENKFYIFRKLSLSEVSVIFGLRDYDMSFAVRITSLEENRIFGNDEGGTSINIDF